MATDLNKTKKVILSGGGTGGSATPLLAVAEAMRQKDKNISFLFVGTKTGPEKKLIQSYNITGASIDFKAIPAGKLRRYFSGYNLIDIFKIIVAFFVSCYLIGREKPNLVLSAGGFVSVPLAWAAYLKKIPVIIHQQDVRPGLANRLMAPTAKIITTTFEKSLADYGSKACWIGNPSPKLPSDKEVESIKAKYGLKSDKPILAITGGGTGSLAINGLIFKSVSYLINTFQIFHLTGAGKAPVNKDFTDLKKYPDYHWWEIISSQDMFLMLKAADLIVSRCGLATLTELCILQKPALLIPIPNSHQEDNARVFAEAEAAVVAKQNNLSNQDFSNLVLSIFKDKNKIRTLSDNIGKIMKPEAASKMAILIWKVMNKEI
jgi:UDP-N-acetylglucosamine--N-acetylmuramyl-(pentapeptide) pyrophosphoryl-undecaprenol N-acetylglucosamine transferase